jgi:hypothetical protein
MEEQVEGLLPEATQQPKRNAGWFRPGDGRINREGRPQGSKAGLPTGIAAEDLAARADRVKRLFVPAQEIACHLSGRKAPFMANLPEDFEIVGSRFDPGRGGFCLTIRSRTFQRIARGALVPEFTTQEGDPSADLAPCDDRLKLLVWPAGQLPIRLSQQSSPWVADLPRDAEIVGSRLDPERQAVVFTIRSRTFRQIARGAPIPAFAPEWAELRWQQP